MQEVSKPFSPRGAVGCALIGCLLLGLTACTSKPNEAEVAGALKMRLKEAGAETDVVVVSPAVDDLQCGSRKADHKYVCSFSVQIAMRGQEKQMSGELIMEKQGNLWTYEKGQGLALHEVTR
jgi:hypothetical protein